MSASDRVGALSGAAFVVFANIGNTIGQDPKLGDYPSGQNILDGYRRMATSAPMQLGWSLELLGWTSLLVFVAYVYTRGRGAGWLAAAGLAGGVTAVAAKFASIAPEVATYILRDSMAPATALALSKVSLASFIIFTLPIGLFLVCGAAAAMAMHRVGRVIGWAGVVIGAASIVVVVFTGPRIDSGFSPMFLIAMVWILVASVVWGFSRTRAGTPRKVEATVA
jgi:hypothetical protein